MSDETSTTSQIFYDGTYKTALSNYTISVSGGGQILVSDVNDWYKFVGIKPPTDSDVYANTRQLMLVYTKPVTGDAFDIANYSWISTDAGQIKFSKAWQLLTATNAGNFNYIDPPTTNETYYLKYVPSAGIQWTTIVNTLPFTENVKSQIIGYDATANQAINVTGTRANYVLQTTNANNTGLQFGYVTPANLNLNYQTIEGTAMVMAKSNNTFELANIYPFSQDLNDGEIIFLDRSDPENPYFNGIDSTSNQFQMLYTVRNEAGFMRWKYDYFNQAVAGLGQNTTETNGKLAMWSNGRLIARNVEDVMGEIDNYFNWSTVLQSSSYFCQSTETVVSYTPTITIETASGTVLKNRYFTYGGNLECTYNITLKCDNLRDYFIDDDNLDGVNIILIFTQCDSNGSHIQDGLSNVISLCNVPVLDVSSPFFKLQDKIVTPFLFNDLPLNEVTKQYMFLPISITISTINDPSYVVVYNSFQSKYKFKLANNIVQSFNCKKLHAISH